MTKLINIFFNDYPKSIEISGKILARKDENFIFSTTFREDADFNLVIGGDGTFLNAIHKSNFSTIPFVGINTGHLGFYQEIGEDKIDILFENLKNNKYSIQDLKLLNCKLSTEDEDKNLLSLNEIVFKAKYTSIIHFDLFVNDFLLQSFAGDGIIFSTPAGSTAYNLSAGGAILYQSLDGFQVTPLAPIRSQIYKSLDKSFVVPNTSTLKLTSKQADKNKSSLTIDGILIDIEDIKNIEISMSDKYIRKLVIDENWYWKNIREKFI